MRSGMMQQQAANSPFFMLPPPGVFPPMWEEDEHDHEHEEDAKEVINQVEKNKRQPGIFGSTGGNSDNSEPFIDPVAEDHQIVPIDESPASQAQVTGAVDPAHADAASHSPMYIIVCILLVAAVGFFLMQNNARESI